MEEPKLDSDTEKPLAAGAATEYEYGSHADLAIAAGVPSGPVNNHYPTCAIMADPDIDFASGSSVAVGSSDQRSSTASSSGCTTTARLRTTKNSDIPGWWRGNTILPPRRGAIPVPQPRRV